MQRGGRDESCVRGRQADGRSAVGDLVHQSADSHLERLVLGDGGRPGLVQAGEVGWPGGVQVVPVPQRVEAAGEIDRCGGVGVFAGDCGAGAHRVQQCAGHGPAFAVGQRRCHRVDQVGGGGGQYAEPATSVAAGVGLVELSAAPRYRAQHVASRLRGGVGADSLVSDRVQQLRCGAQRADGGRGIGLAGGQVGPGSGGDVVEQFGQRGHGVTSARRARRR